jgi:mannose-6-phosphate isomerase
MILPGFMQQEKCVILFFISNNSMNELYPLKFLPVFKEKLWGGTGIRDTLGLDFGSLPNCGEAWLISGVRDNVSVVADGFLAGNELNELVEVYMGDLVGDAVYERYGDEFPILVKIIDAADYLSVQVHPDDELALRRGLPNGKSEMWYILQAGQGAHIINGFSRRLGREDYLKHLEEGRLRDILNYMPVERGDVVYIPGGRVHALGPGIMLAEVQQTSDTTYRIYDWDRVDASGKPRDLHTDLALDAIDFAMVQSLKTTYAAKPNTTETLVAGPYFDSTLLHFNRFIEKDYSELDSFVIHLCLEGSYSLMTEAGIRDVQQGEALLLPAVTGPVRIMTLTGARLLEIYIRD